MQSSQRALLRSSSRLRPQVQRQCRRHASDSPKSDHGHHEAPANETLGANFFLSLAAIPLSIAVYQFTVSDKENPPFFTRYISEKYAEYRAEFERRNDTHTRAMEQAAADRVLFLNETNRNVRQVQLRFPEQLNFGSPWNVHAGHSHANIDELVEKYRRESFEDQQKKLKQLRENNVPAEQTVEPLTKLVPTNTSF